jgi:hypothetical protein
MLALWNVGPLVERLLGNLSFLVMYLASGLLASVASLLWHPQTISAGASGAVFGVFGALLGFLLRHPRSIPAEVLAEYRKSTLAFLLYNVVFGFIAQGIDMAAHMGGLAVGFVCGLILSQPLGSVRTVHPLRILLVAVGSPALAALLLTTAVGDVTDFSEEMRHFADTEKQVLDQVHTAARKVEQGQMSAEDFANALEQKAIPQWSLARERLLHLRGLNQEQQQIVTKLANYMQTREEGWRLLAEAVGQDDMQKLKQAQEKQRAADALVQQLNQEQSKR